MTWLNPWAWTGLIAVALPVLIHMLGRTRAPTQRFPSLRFIEPSRLLPRRLARPHDPLLLAVRISIFAAAVAALARPTFGVARRAGAGDNVLARAIVVDTSASLRRRAATGIPGLQAARREAARLAGEAPLHLVLEADAPGDAVAGAVAWLARQRARAELVIVSDFQMGALDERDLAVVPAGFGVRLDRIAVAAGPATFEAAARVAQAEVAATIIPGPDRTAVEWRARQAHASPAGDAISVFAGVADRRLADASLAASRAVGAGLPTDASRAIAVVFPGYEQREALLRGGHAPQQPWMAEVLARIGDDSLPAVEDVSHGRARLVIFPRAAAGTVASASLLAAVARARSAAIPPAEMEPAEISSVVLSSWERATAASAPRRDPPSREDGDDSDGRWFWLLALALVAVESWVRRPPRPEPHPAST